MHFTFLSKLVTDSLSSPLSPSASISKTLKTAIFLKWNLNFSSASTAGCWIQIQENDWIWVESVMAGIFKPPVAFAVTPHKVSICILVQVYAQPAQITIPFPFSSVADQNRLGILLFALTKVIMQSYMPFFLGLLLFYLSVFAGLKYSYWSRMFTFIYEFWGDFYNYLSFRFAFVCVHTYKDHAGGKIQFLVWMHWHVDYRGLNFWYKVKSIDSEQG